MIHYPNDDDGEALQRIAAGGSDMSKPMAVDFAVAVPNEEAGEAIARLADAQDFDTSVEQDTETGDWTCYCARTMVATYEAVVSAQRQLDELAAPHRGYCDGWGSFGNVAVPPPRQG